jgi:hypothetical protein
MIGGNADVHTVERFHQANERSRTYDTQSLQTETLQHQQITAKLQRIAVTLFRNDDQRPAFQRFAAPFRIVDSGRRRDHDTVRPDIAP